MDTQVSSLPPLLTIDKGIARLTFRRPAQANRLETGDLAVIMDYTKELSTNRSVRVLVIEGEGRYFSSGYDINQILEMARNNPEGTIENPFEPVIEAVERLPQTTIARLHGGVYGGSTDLALACDFRVGSTQTEMFMPAAALGLLYYPSGIKRFVSRLGADYAKRLFLLGEKINAAEMQRIGFLTDLVAPEQLDAAIAKLTDRLTTLAPLAMQETKLAIDALSRGSFDHDAFKQREADILRSEDLREGLAAFREKRPAVFQGK